MHWGRIIRNVFSNWTSYFVTAVIGFLLAPFVVHSLGNTGYGLWTLVLSVTGYFGLLDLGIRSSVGRFVARYLALNDAARVNRTATTAMAILTAGGVLALLATLVTVAAFFDAFKLAPEFRAVGRQALLLTGLNVACILPLSVFSAVLIGLERFDVTSGITIVGELTRAALVITVLRTGGGLIGLSVISIAVTLGQYSAMAIFAKVLYQPLKIGWGLVDRETFRELMGFSIYRFIWIIANQLIFWSDSIVIGIFLGASRITFYAIAGSLINYSRTVVALVTDTLYPAATRMDARKDLPGLRRLLIDGTKIALVVALPLCMGLILLGKQFIVLWMGSAYASSAIFLAVLAIAQLASMPQNASALILAGMAKHKVLAWLVLGEGAANLILSVILVQRIGLIGVAWGTVIPDVISMAVIVPIYTLRTLELGMREYLTKAVLPPVLCAIPTAGLAYTFSVWIQNPTWLGFGAEVLSICALFGGLSYFLCLEARQRAAIMEKLCTLVYRDAIVHEA